MNKILTAKKMQELDAKYEYYRQNPEESRKVCLRRMEIAPRVMTREEFEREKARRRKMKKK